MVAKLVGLWNVGSAPLRRAKKEGQAEGDELPLAKVQSFFYDFAAMISLVLGGGEGRKGNKKQAGEQSWVVGIITKISRALWIPLVGVDNYLQNGIHIVLGALLGWFYGPLVWLGILKLPDVPYDKWAIQDRGMFDAREHREDARFMRGISSARALKWFAGAVWLGLWRFEAKIIESVDRLLRAPGMADTILQFELPFELGLGAKFPLPRRLRQRLYKVLLRSIERIIRSTPKGTAFAFHLCWGDLAGRPFVRRSRQSTMAKIDMYNAVMAMSVWKEGWVLYATQEPYGDGVDAPTITEEEIEQIEKYLNPLPEHLQDLIWALGVLHLLNSADVTLDLVTRLTTVLSKKGVKFFALATPCGNGRMSYDDVQEIIKRAEEVLRRYQNAA